MCWGKGEEGRRRKKGAQLHPVRGEQQGRRKGVNFDDCSLKKMDHHHRHTNHNSRCRGIQTYTHAPVFFCVGSEDNSSVNGDDVSDRKQLVFRGELRGSCGCDRQWSATWNRGKLFRKKEILQNVSTVNQRQNNLSVFVRAAYLCVMWVDVLIILTLNLISLLAVRAMIRLLFILTPIMKIIFHAKKSFFI